jgi:serine/threonine-protein kinase
MQPERFRRIEELFLHAVDLPPGERERWLDEACAGDADLRERVASMIEHDARVTGGLARSIEAAAEAALRIGQRLGPYHLERELGRGGMGTVYLATRVDDQYRMHVAIKIATGALDSPEVLRRFREEREILARLEHPNIARLLDAGTTAEGLPYVVMEHVQGLPVDRYCDERRLGAAERLALFRGICAAVQHAHRNLVVHRDLKPSNVLVTADGVPKLLDFGIAKLLDPLDPAPARTRTALRRLTPGYASPEQVRGEPVTTATDIYSLGVLLYELLAGRPPYRLDTTRPGEMERTICEVEPERPSLVVTRALDAGAREIAAARRTTPKRLARALAGDLDTIVLAALRKEPARRYPSVEQLAEDLRRHVEGLPVLARPDSRRYRAAKFVGRHRVETAAVAVLLALVVGFGASMALLARRTARERDTAERVTEFLVDVFQVPDPAAGRGRDVTAREILDEGAVRIERELTGTPLVRARLMAAMGRAYVGLGLLEQARPLLDGVVEIRRRELGTSDPLVAESLVTRSDLAQREADLASAESLAREAVEIARRHGRRSPGTLAGSLRSLGSTLRSAGRVGEAETVLHEALAVARRETPDADPRPLVATLRELAWIHESRGEFAEAEALHREALSILEARYGRESAYVGSELSSLGESLRVAGNYAEAELLLREGLAISGRVRGERHPSTAQILEDLALLLQNTGRYDEAIDTQRDALEIQREYYGEATYGVAVTKANLAGALWDLDRLDEAETLNREVVATLRDLVGEQHPDYLSTLNNLAQILHQQKRYDEADGTFIRVIELQRGLPDENKPGLAYYLNNRGMLLRDMGDLVRAEASLREALELRQTTIGTDHPLTAASMTNLASVLADRGAYDEAEPLLRQAVAAERARLPAGRADPATLFSFGRVLVLGGRAAEAEPVLREAAAAFRATTAAGATWRAAACEVVLAASFAAQGRRAEAESLAGPALDVLRHADRLDRVASVRHLLQP